LVTHAPDGGLRLRLGAQKMQLLLTVAFH
jgi:hypothetical protein